MHWMVEINFFFLVFEERLQLRENQKEIGVVSSTEAESEEWERFHFRLWTQA